MEAICFILNIIMCIKIRFFKKITCARNNGVTHHSL